ncbi:DUF6090 family protein [Hanstruepera marina]|uniref:DUF6090 family protein n=1 Tax=Hanstruepera marina TaxID=2873265 RepID=UPI001CA66607|nr:DUF6090 family protein [Hanstruepera marina]
MIKFFRNIRKNLLNKGKTSKYLKYAIGEIVLVVIGILIALAINKWNQKIQESKQGKVLLERIHHDLVQDTLLFRKTVEKNVVIREDIKHFLNTMYSGVENKKQVEKMSATFDKALDQIFSYNKTTYNSIMSTGSINLINNPKLKDDILELYNSYEEIEELLNSINEWMLNVTSTLDTKTNFIKFNTQVSDIYTYKEMITEKDFEFLNNQSSEEFQILVRAISATAFNQKVRNMYYQDLIKKCHTTLQHINIELEK